MCSTGYQTSPVEFGFDKSCPSGLCSIMARTTHSVVCKHCQKKFLAITVSHLRKSHDYRGDHPVLKYKRRFGLQFSMCGKTRERFSQRANAHWEKLGQHWTKPRLIAEIKRLHRAGHPLRLTVAPIKLVRAAEKLIGSWKAAVEEAGLQYDDLLLLNRWSRKKIITTIWKLAEDGIPLDATSIRRDYSPLFCATKLWFKSNWGNALEAAGIDPKEHKKHRGRWDRQKAGEWVRKQVEKGNSILARDIPVDLKNFAQYYVDGGWAGFVESLGISYPGKRDRIWTKDLVLEEIRRMQSEGERLHYSAVKVSDSNLLRKALEFYGKWDIALTAAGITTK
jgi:hypothetical protein